MPKPYIQHLKTALGEWHFIKLVRQVRRLKRLQYWHSDAIEALKSDPNTPNPPEDMQVIIADLAAVVLPEPPSLDVLPDWCGVHSLGGQSPVQAQGEMDGHEWYFRARWEHYSVSVANMGDDALDVEDTGNGYYFEHPYGYEAADASFMPEGEARYAIRNALLEARVHFGLPPIT